MDRMPSPSQVKAAALHARLTEHAKRWPQITEVTVRYRAKFAYIDAVLMGRRHRWVLRGGPGDNPRV